MHNKQKPLSLFLSLPLIFSLFYFSGCKKKDAEIDGENSVETGADAPRSTRGSTEDRSPFWVRVETEYQFEQDQRTLQGVCAYPSGAAEKSPVIQCQIDIPEGQLFFSRLFLSVGLNDAPSCEIVNFRPYRYKITNKDNFLEELGSKINCSGVEEDSEGELKSVPIPKDCYGGVATALVPEFPRYKARYFTRENQTEGEFEVVSAAHNDNRFTSNRWAANYFPNRSSFSNTGREFTMNIGGGINLHYDGYNGSEFSDYFFSCRDKYYEQLYGISLIIKAIPIETDDNNYKDFSTW